MPPYNSCLLYGHPYPEVTGAICLVPSTSFSLRLGILYQFTSVGLGYGPTLELFPGSSRLHSESNYLVQLSTFVTSSGLRNINLISIDYASRPRLRDRLTLRRLTLRRNPWTFGGNVSRISLRYSCQHSHLWYLQHASRHTFTDLHNAPLPLK